MATVCVRGVGRWKAAGWLWLRVRGRKEGEDRVLLEKCLRCGDDNGEWTEEQRVNLQIDEGRVVTFELWTGAIRETELLQFVTAWNVDLERWIQSEATKRWYEIGKRRVGGEELVYEGEDGHKYCESDTELHSSAAYLCISVAAAVDKNVDLPQPETLTLTMEKVAGQEKSFHFILPHRPLARSSKLRAVRVGEIVHELRTDILCDLLPLTLYGYAKTQQCQRTSTNKFEGTADGVAKALELLQLSCQYANYCVNELDRHSCHLESRRIKHARKLNRLKLRQNLLKDQTTNLKREAEVLSCSLEGMESLLHEVDHQTLVQLQCDSNSHNRTS